VKAGTYNVQPIKLTRNVILHEREPTHWKERNMIVERANEAFFRYNKKKKSMSQGEYVLISGGGDSKGEKGK